MAIPKPAGNDARQPARAGWADAGSPMRRAGTSTTHPSTTAPDLSRRN